MLIIGYKIINKEHIGLFPSSLEKINCHKYKKIRFPGRGDYVTQIKDWTYDHLYMYRDNPHWFFLGGLFGGHKDNLLIFAKEVIKTIQEMKKRNYITWEVNIWTNVYFRCRELFEIYIGGHDISMLYYF